MMYIVVGLFAMAGALLRDGIGQVTLNWWSGSFPVATLVINIIGCFVLGWFTNHIKKLSQVHPYIKTGVGTGLIGSFTTFSTFSVETIRLFESGHLLMGIVYLLTSYFGGWLFAFLGVKLGDHLIYKRQEVVK